MELLKANAEKFVVFFIEDNIKENQLVREGTAVAFLLQTLYFLNDFKLRKVEQINITECEERVLSTKAHENSRVLFLRVSYAGLVFVTKWEWLILCGF